MARPLVADRVKETTLTTGTGQLTLAGAGSGFFSFEQSFASGVKVYYLVVDDPDSTTQFELGIGTFTQGTPNKLSRDKVLRSSNGGALVNLLAGGTVIVPYSAYFLRGIIDSIDSDLVTAGTSTALTLVSYRPDADLYEGRFICFKLHVANGASATLNVDGLGAKALVDFNGTAIPAGAMVSGAYYWAKYDATAGKWVVFSPFNMGAASSKNLGADIVDDGSGNLTRKLTRVGQTANVSFAAADRGKRHRFEASGKTGTLLAAATAGDGWNIEIEDAAGGTTIASPATNLYVNGAAAAASYTFTQGETGSLICDGTGYYLATNKPPAMVIQGGFKSLKIVAADGGTAPVVTADQITVESAGGNALRASSVSVTLDLTGTGAGKLDTGTIAAATWYYLWVIAKPDGAVSAVASLSSSSPVMPSGYTFKARVGAVRTKPSSAVLIGTLQFGRRAQYTQAPLPEMGSPLGSVSVPTWVAVSVAGFVPPTASRIQGYISLTTGGGRGILAPNSGYGAYSDASNRPPVSISFSGLAGGQASLPFDFVLESGNIYGAGGQPVICSGWEDNL